ncbi:MAG: hypothetical protein HeimC2_12890 [Candidatus Heimdallarchaeota archaeon LC_2]|nr:MAG: hypothetical protein HeimC2_12890 [Candidatus Heimdallarchaeota archaeon LC_2]
MVQSNQIDSFKEILYFGGILILFLLSLRVIGSPNFNEILILILAYTITWAIVRMSIKRFGVGSLESEDLQKELKWFGVSISIFLVFLIIIGIKKYSDLIISGLAFSFIWSLRSLLIKRYYKPIKNINKINT